MLKAVFFDLDGTLLPLDEDNFTKVYFHYLYETVKDRGYDKQKFIEAIWGGTKAMYKNDGSKPNEDVFWDYFCGIFGKDKIEDKAIIDDFYVNDFKKTKACCKENPLAKSIANYAKAKCGISILSTNPIFPRPGTLTRMSFVGLSESDFDYITTYENCSYAKPNPKYFESILEKFNLKPSEVILFGNNDLEDYMCAKKAGIDCYLVGDYIIKHEEYNIDFPQIKMEEVIDVIDKEFEKRR